MTTTRILLEQGGKLHRFLLLDSRPDGSIVMILDRDSRVAQEAMTFDVAKQKFVPDNSRKSHTKITCHITGQVNYYCGSEKPKQILYIEKLTGIQNNTAVAFFSIPCVSRLDSFSPSSHRHDSEAILPIPENVNERLAFVVEVAPIPPTIESYGVAINYELYAIIIRLIPPSSVPHDEQVANHFIHGVPNIGTMSKRAIGIPEAEIEFHKKIHGKTPLIFRDSNGIYTVIASVPMRVTPTLKIVFSREDLSYEQDMTGTQKIHKVRFWIKDKGRKNLRDDLRSYIASVELSAEL